MAFTQNQQVFELVKKSRQILIVIRQDWDGDSLASALSLLDFLRKLDKKVDVACSKFKPSNSFSFLPSSEIKSKLDNLQKFVISVDITKTELGEFEYDEADGRLNIFITPKLGQLTKEDVSVSMFSFKYDLIFLINSPDLESLGDIYQSNPDFFYTVTKINIDRSYNNEYCGDINLVNLTAAATTEILFDLFKEWNEDLIDENIATWLLTGIIAATKNFKSTKVTPHILNLAGILIAKGARRDQIIQNLYQSRFISTLKLWGRVLSRLNNDLDDKIIWSILSRQDFLETATSPEELIDVIEELIISMPKTEVIVLLYEDNQSNIIKAIVYSVKKLDAMYLTRKFEPEGNKEMVKFSLSEKNLAQAEREVIEEIKKQIL